MKRIIKIGRGRIPYRDLIKKFKDAGFKIDDTEETRGAMKAWMIGYGSDGRPLSNADLVSKVREIISGMYWMEEENEYTGEIIWRADDFEVETQVTDPSVANPGQIFIAVYKTGEAGIEYSMGVDV